MLKIEGKMKKLKYICLKVFFFEIYLSKGKIKVRKTKYWNSKDEFKI